MADIEKTLLTRDSSTTLTFVNGAADQNIVMDCADDKMILLVQNTDSTTARVRVKAGDGISSALGDIYVDVEQNTYKILGPFSGMRFKDIDTGKINVVITGTSGSAFGGTITNVKIRPIVLP